MTRRSWLYGLILGLVLVMLSGCTVYSKQDYGPNAVSLVPTSSDATTVLRELGAPNMHFQTKDGKDVLIWKKYEGFHLLNIYSTVEKNTLTIVLQDGQVKEVINKPEGKAMTILGIFTPPILETE
ncbi:MAG: hypothetical protein V2A74_15300 [bacterium]